MLIPARISKKHAISPVTPDFKWLDVWPRIAIDGPGIELGTVQRASISKGERKGLVRFLSGLPGSELRVVPVGSGGGGISPQRLANTTGVLDDHS